MRAQGQSESGCFPIDASTFEEGIYHSALTVFLPPALKQAIQSLRQRLPFSGPSRYQLSPHLTVLYLGKMDRTQLVKLSEGLDTLGPITLAVALTRLATFGQGEIVHNIHLRVDPVEPILNLHRAALQRCAELHWKPQTEYTHELYVPHISVLARLNLAVQDVMRALDVPMPTQIYRLTDLGLLTERAVDVEDEK